MYTPLWPTGDRKIELRRWILACIFFNRLNIKVQYPVENNRAKNFIWEWKCHQFLSTILLPGPLLPNMQRLDGTRDPFSSGFLVIIIQYEGPVHNPLHYLSQSLRLYKDIEEEDTTRRNVLLATIMDGYRVQSKPLEQKLDAGSCIQLCSPALHSHKSGLTQLKWILVPSKAVLLFTLKFGPLVCLKKLLCNHFAVNLYLLEANWVLQLLHPCLTGLLQALPGSHKLLAFLAYFLSWWVLAYNHCLSFIQDPLDLLFVGIHFCLQFLKIK